MRYLQMDNEDPPCRDTDPVNMNLVGKTSDTMAFTIDFGGDDINQEEKVKKFERFAQRSSLRRVQSPRQEKTAEKEKLSEESRANNNSLTVNLNKSDPASPPSPTKPPKETRITKERRSTVVLEKGPRSISHNRLDSRRKESGGARKASNEDALSHTGTYTMEEDVESRKDLPDVALIDKTRFIADWRAKHSGSAEDNGPGGRRVLPSAPSKDEITEDSLKEVEKFLARSELTSNIRPGFKPSNKPLIDNSQANGPTSFRSLPYSTNYHQPRQELGPRTSLRRKPVTGTSSYLLSKTNGTSNRSNSCLTSGQAEYKAWKTRKESKIVPSSSATNTNSNTSSSSSSSATSSKLAGKLPLRMSQSLMSPSGNMKRSNSFHHENIQQQQQSRPACKSTKESSPAAEPITYRTSEDYYLDEDELFLPIFSTEDEPSEARGGRREERGGVSALDTLGQY